MNILGDVTLGGVKGLLEGAGSLAKDIRSAITGEISPEKKAELMERAEALEAQGMQAQAEINKIEAASPKLFVSGWRPYIGWICGTSLGLYYIPQTIAATVLWTIQCWMIICTAEDITTVTLPSLALSFSMAEIIGLVTSLLGIGALRTYEKKAGVARN
jgi:hypothetical protein